MLFLFILHIENWLFKLRNWVDATCFLCINLSISCLTFRVVIGDLFLELMRWPDDLRVLGLGWHDWLLVLQTRVKSRLRKPVALTRLHSTVLVVRNPFQFNIRFRHFPFFRVGRTVTISIRPRSSWTRSLIDVNWSSWDHIWIFILEFNYIIYLLI
jgi:hypothetical protein